MLRITFALVALVVCAGPAVACGYPTGQRIVLASSAMDPDVFVWDSRQRAVDYASGFWRNTHDVIEHTLLIKPGTHAMIVACAADAVRSKYSQRTEDAIGLRVLDGPSRGRYGWVHAEDIHLDRIHTAKEHTDGS